MEIPFHWELQDFPYFAFGPQSIGSPGRIFMFDKILEIMKERGMWITTCGEMASYIRQ